MLSGNGQAVHICIISGYQPSLSNAFDLISGNKFGEDIISKYLEIKMGHPRLSIGEFTVCTLYMHAHNALSTTAW